MDKKKPSVFTESLLNYQVSTDPSPVLISPQPGEGAELYTSFQIRVTPKSSDTVAVSKLYFILSLGNSETDISSSDEASSFSVSDDSKWQFIRLSPGLYQASPAGGKDRELIGKEGIVFNIYNLPVNPEVQSTVITVKEESYRTSGSLIKASVELPIGTSSFVKDFYFENFIAEKPVVELHGKAVLKWIGSDNAGYLLYSSNEPWNPPLDVSKQRTWTSPPLTQNTIFVLTATQVVNGETKRRDLSVMVIVKGGAENNNIYTIDGTLTGNRTVTQNTNTLAFKSSVVNAFSVDGKTFSVDAKNNRIGVGTDEPTRKLHVEGGQFLNAVKSASISKDTVDINIGEDGYGYGNRSENFGINVRSSSSRYPGPVSRINFGDTSTLTTQGSGTRYLSFSVGRNLNELMYLTDKDGGKVGIGTITPTNVLHVNSSTKGAVRIVDGTQGPDKVLTSDASGVGTWKSLPEKTVEPNIYKNDGTLTGNRTVTQNTKTLAFKGSAVNAFSVGGTTFSVDAKNNRIGIGTNSPTRKLHVEGGQFLNAVRSSISTNALDINIGEDGYGYGNRNANWGINMKSSSSRYPGPVSRINFGDTSTTSASGTRYLSFNVGIIPNELMYLTDKDGGKVGIGTIDPSNVLHVNSSTKGAVRIVDGTQGTDKVLTSDASGVGTWKSLPEKTADTNIYKNNGILTGNRTVTQNTNTLAFEGLAVNAFSVDGKTFSVDAKNKRIGIGTNSPTSKLHVEGSSLLNGRAQIGELQVLSSDNNPGRIISHRGLRFTTGATETATDMIIKQDGKVGVGTTSPTEKLDVEGIIKASGLIIEKGQVKMFGKAISMKSGDNWKANTDGIFIGHVYPPGRDETKRITSIYGYVSDIMMGRACGYSANVPNGVLNIGDVFSMPVKKGDKFSCKVDVLRGSELTTQFYWIPLGSNDSNTFEYTGESTGGDSLENAMIVVEEDSFSSLFSKTMEKLMEDVPKEQREAKMERIVKKLMEG